MRKLAPLPLLLLLAAACATAPRPRPLSDAQAWERAAEVAAVGAQPGVVDVQTARRLRAAGAVVVDVRTPAEYAAGHVPGALNVPHQEVASRHGEIGPPSTPVLLYCASGRRSGIGAAALREKGFAAVYDFQRWEFWVKSEPRPAQ